MSSLEQGSPLDKAKAAENLTEFDRRVYDSMSKALWLPNEFKEYMVQYLTLNQPLVPAGQVIGLNNTLPRVIDIDVFPTSNSHTNWNTIDATAAVYANQIYGGVKESSGAQNAEINWDVLLTTGIWTVELLHFTRSSNGIYSVQVDGIEKGTIDGYSAADAANVRSSVTGITVEASATVQLKLKMATKNASSSSYFGRVSHIQLRRTD
jgi:hypothetical protein